MKSDFQALRRDLEETLGPVSLPTTGTVWCIVSATFCLFLYRWVGLHSLEPTVFNYVIFAGVCLLWATVLFSIIRLMHIWAVLKKVLRRLERLPIRYAFSRIPSTFSWGPVWQRGGLRRSYLVQARSLEYLRCLSAESAPASQSEAQAFRCCCRWRRTRRTESCSISYLESSIGSYQCCYSEQSGGSPVSHIRNSFA